MATSKIGKYDLDDNLKNELEEIKKSVSDGKTLVANAITDKGISTATDATFATMATNIESIRDLGNLNEMGAYTDSPICGTFISDATKGPYITAAVPKGVYRTSGGEFTNYPTLKIYRNDFASTIGLDAEKIMQGKYIAQIAGTATSDATANASHIVKDKIAYVKGAKVIGTMPVKAAATYTPKTTNQTIAAGQYLTGVQTIKGDANLKAANIKSGVSIFGISGTLVDANQAVAVSKHDLTVTDRVNISSTTSSGTSGVGGKIVFSTIPQYLILDQIASSGGTAAYIFPRMKKAVQGGYYDVSMTDLSSYTSTSKTFSCDSFGGSSWGGYSYSIYFSTDFKTMYFYVSAYSNNGNSQGWTPPSTVEAYW